MVGQDSHQRLTVGTFDRDIPVLHFAVVHQVGLVVETKLHSYHVGVLVPGYGFDVFGPHRLALHRTGQFHLIRSKPAGSFSKNIRRGNIMHARCCHKEALFLFNEAQLSVYPTNSCRFAKLHGWICYLSPKPVTRQVTT